MTQRGINPDDFPELARSIRAKWAPIMLEPIMGSGERLVIAVAAISANAFHVESANVLRRLECLYGPNAETVIFSAKLAIDEIREDIAVRAISALTDPAPGLSGVIVGEVSEGEAGSLEEIAQNWMSNLSSLYDYAKAQSADMEVKQAVDTDMGRDRGGYDRLPGLVMDYVTDQRSGLKEFFRKDIREGRGRRKPGKSHEILIDFSGSRLVANFGTFMPGKQADSVQRITYRMWQLKVDRDTQKDSLISLDHEMVVQHPSFTDPQITEAQHRSIEETLEALEQQANVEELRFRPLTSVPAIGDHLLSAELGQVQ